MLSPPLLDAIEVCRTAVTCAPWTADYFGMNFIANLRQLWGLVMFVLGLIRWYRTPEAKELLGSIT